MNIIEINNFCCGDNCCDRNNLNVNDYCELFQNLKNNCCKPYIELKINCCVLFDILNNKENKICKSGDKCCDNKNNIKINNNCCELFDKLKEIDKKKETEYIIKLNTEVDELNNNIMKKTFTFRRLQQFAIGISILSIFYNGAEGAISIAFGNENGSNSLIFFGIQSFVEVISACFVVWRFIKVALPGEEQDKIISDNLLNKERKATIGIGILFGILTIGTWASSINTLVHHNHPDSSTASLIISASALIIMILVWLPKPYLAKALNSSAMHGEAKCSLACIYITIVLLIGTIIYRFWEGGWWVDSATAIILGVLFLKECIEMILWGLSKEFSGGCCKTCSKNDEKNCVGKENKTCVKINNCNDEEIGCNNKNNCCNNNSK